MKICVLQPDYSASTVDYAAYDPTRDLSAILPGHFVDHVALDKRTTYRQLKGLSKGGYDIFINLCEGYLDWDIPSIDVIESLERLGLPYTGPSTLLYDPSKALMKYVAHTAGVRTPAHALVSRPDDEQLGAMIETIGFPMFVKPGHAGDSLGIDAGSMVLDTDALRARVDGVVTDFGEALVEEYIDGREFTVLVVSDSTPAGATALTPVEYVFPEGSAFKTYAHKTSELHPDANIAVTDEPLSARLRDAALRVFQAFSGVGYARMDFRLDATGELFFLEINFACSVFYTGGYEGSADHILRFDPMGAAGFAERIIADGMARHRRRQVPWILRGNAIDGYGISSRQPLRTGDMVYRGEARAHRVVTARHVETSWNAADQLTFRRYGYPLSSEIFALWSDDPTSWAPQNHSCHPNTAFRGLDVIALRDIESGEELTLDYAQFMHEGSEPFDCQCGAQGCRGLVTGTIGNSVTSREHTLRRAGESIGAWKDGKTYHGASAHANSGAARASLHKPS